MTETQNIGTEGGNASAAVDYSTFLDREGNFKQPVAGKFTTLEGLTKSYENLQKMMSSADKVAVPGEGSSDEEWGAFYSKLGRPESPEGYTFEVADEVKKLEGVYDEEGLKAYAQVAHQAGLTPKQASTIADLYFKGMAHQHAEVEGQRQAVQEAYTKELAKEWGPKDSPRWKQNEALADVGMDALGLTADDIAAMPEARSPAFLKAMAKVAGFVKERPTSGIGGENAARAGAAQGIQEQIDKIMGDPTHAFYNKNAIGHKDAVEQLLRLRETKHAYSD